MEKHNLRFDVIIDTVADYIYGDTMQNNKSKYTLSLPLNAPILKDILKRLDMGNETRKTVQVVSCFSNINFEFRYKSFNNLEEVNYLATLLDDLDKYDFAKYNNIVSSFAFKGDNVKDYINLALKENLDKCIYIDNKTVHCLDSIKEIYRELEDVPKHLLVFKDDIALQEAKEISKKEKPSAKRVER